MTDATAMEHAIILVVIAVGVISSFLAALFTMLLVIHEGFAHD